jgi:hypothetical protein
MKDYEKIAGSNGMKVLRDIIHPEGTKTYDVIFHNISKEYWQKVIEETEDNHVCALGTPGIGKTSTTCVLIRLLLQKKKTVVYHLRTLQKEGMVYIYTPSMINSTVDVDVVDEKDFKANNNNTSSTYYVVDPGQTKGTCDLGDTFKGKVLILASPDSCYWGDSQFFKGRNNVSGTLLVYPIWSLDELIFAKNHLGYNLKDVMISLQL